MKKDENTQTFFSVLTGAFSKYLKKNYPMVILTFVTFLITVALVFVKISTSSTVSSFNINDYEIGQISDVTIKAVKSLPSDYENPVEVLAGEKVIRKGFPITEEGYAKLKKMSESAVYVDYRAFANSVIYHILMCALFFVCCSKIYFKAKMIEFKELVTECCFYIIIFSSVIFGSKSIYFASPYAICAVIPSSVCVFLVAILFGQLNAVFFSLIISLSVLNASSYQIVPFLFVLSTSFASARLVRKINRRTDMVLVSVLQSLLNVVFLMIFKIIFSDSLYDGLGAIVGVALNGFFSGILCLGLLTPLELLLNSASLFRLMDLSDLNNPTMKKMLVTASGTYNHSLMVASLAEAACNEVGANPLLARVGAYYHDIGKLDNPEYFVENQTAGENIHTEINPSLSVSIIRSHVKRGVEKARALRLPKQIIDIISEHHGNQVIAYFYNEAKAIDPDANPEDYSYTGNPPTTRESAIVMLADTVEAACRSLEKPSVPRLEKFITTLIYGKIEHKQLENCNLTFRDITKIHDAFVQILAGYYHSRTKYPDQKDPDTNEVHQIPLPPQTQVQHQGNSDSAEKDKSVKEEKNSKKSLKDKAEKNHKGKKVMGNQIFVGMEDGRTSPVWIDKIEPFAQKVMQKCGWDGEEFSILFCSDEYIQYLNKTYRNIDNPTDVLSFENGEKYTDEDNVVWLQAGDIAISVDTLPKNSEYFAVSQNEELKRLIIHGILHLNGYDHGEEHVEKNVEPKCEMLVFQKKLMKDFEQEILIEETEK